MEASNSFLLFQTGKKQIYMLVSKSDAVCGFS